MHFLTQGPFLRFYVFLNKVVKNGPRNMKFGTNVVCTIRNKKKLNNRLYLEKSRERERERERENFGHNHRVSEKHDYHRCMKIN